MKTFDKYITYAIYNIIQRQAQPFINGLKINLNKISFKFSKGYEKESP